MNKKTKIKYLTNLCIKYFGKNFEHWNWIVDSGNIEGYPRKIGVAIELPKKTINGNECYTDPFIAYSGGEAKSLEICCDNAIKWIKQNFI